MNNIVNLKDGLLTFNSNIDNSLTFSKCAIGYSNNDHVHERGSILFLTNNSEDNTSVNIDTDVKMSISSIGNIGIGGSLNTGENKLEVDGNINISSGNTYKINNYSLAYSNLIGLVPVENIPIGNNLIINNNNIGVDLAYYTGDATINGDLIVNSNLIVNGQSLQFNSTEKLEIINTGIGPTLNIRQESDINNIVNISNYENTEVFNITSEGYINFTEQINGIDKTQFSKIANIDSNDSNCSNFVLSTSNLLLDDYILRDQFTSNFVLYTCNLLLDDYILRDQFTSNFVESTSNLLLDDYILRNQFTSNFVLYTCNLLLDDYILRDQFTSNFVESTSNLLLDDYILRDQFTSNFVESTSNLLFEDYVARDSSLATAITTSIEYTSNYVDINKYTDDKVITVLSTSAGNNLVWNNVSKQFDVPFGGDYNSLTNKLTAGNNIHIDNNDNNKVSLHLDIYNGNSTFNGNLTVNNDLIVLGSQTSLSTNAYSTETLTITNSGIGPTLTIKQTSLTNNIVNISNYLDKEVFNITVDGNVNFSESMNGINKTQFSKIANIDSNDSNCSNFIRSSSNLLFGDYVLRDNFTSNFIRSSSNLLFGDYVMRDNFTSNFVMNASNLLFSDYVLRDNFTSNLVMNASNLLFGDYVLRDNFTSNFISASSNLLFGDYVLRDSFTSNFVMTASNLLFDDYVLRDNFTSNFVITASNLLFDDYVARDNFTSNFVMTASNLLFDDYVLRDNFTSNFVMTASNLLFDDYVARDNSLISEITTSIGYTSNYVDINKYTDENVKNVLSTSAGNNIVWNEVTKQFDTSSSGDYNSLTNKLAAGNNISIDSYNSISVDLAYYTGDATINGDLTVNSNLIVNGQAIQLNTTEYSTEKLDIINTGSGPSLSVKQSSQTNNIVNISNYENTEVFNITPEGYINFTAQINGIDKTQFSKIANIDSNDSNCSNFVRSTSNNLFDDYALRDNFTSNFIRSTSNHIFDDYVARDHFTSNFIRSTSNNLFDDYALRDNFTSNFIRSTSNHIFDDYVLRDNFTSNFIRSTSNHLFDDYVSRDHFTSNFMRSTSNNLFDDYVERDSSLATAITTSAGYTSNYVNINKYTDDKVKTVLSNSAGNNMVWNNVSKRFDVPFDGNYNSLTNKLTAGNNIHINNSDNNKVSLHLDIYNGDTTINGNLTVNSNIILMGTQTSLNTNAYSTETLTITNAGMGPTLTIKQTSLTNNIVNVSNYLDKEVFNITVDGNVNFSETMNGIDVTQFSKIANIDSNDLYVSNFVRGSSDILFADYSTRFEVVTSELTTYADNIGTYTSNYVSESGNLLFIDYSSRFDYLSATAESINTNASNYVDITSNLLFADYVTRDDFTCNFVIASSNLLFTDYVARDEFTSNFVIASSNMLFVDYIERFTAMSLSSSANATWITTGNNIYSSNSGNVGIGTEDPSAYKLQVIGAIGASGDIVASYSDERLKDVTEHIKDVLPILNKINGFRYICNDVGEKHGYDKSKKELGLSAQEIQKYYPELVSLAPFDSVYDSETKQIISKSGENYLTLKYERLIPVLVQGIKELNVHIEKMQENEIKKDIELKDVLERLIRIEERLDKT
jgi:hypothetical protein